MQTIEKDNIKAVKSPFYNYVFDKKTGFFARWGQTKEDDPEFSPYGPEIADIEISSANDDDVKNANSDMIITNGGCSGKFCKKFCYKQSTSDKTVHMSLDTFKQILDRFIHGYEIHLEDGSIRHYISTDIIKLTNGESVTANLVDESMDIL